MSERLSLQHPDYRYPPPRNPYFNKFSELPGPRRIFSDNDAELHRSHWSSQFPDVLSKKISSEKRPLHLEIGCNGGHLLLEYAARNPKDCFLGLDWKFKQIYFGAEKAIKRSIDNILFLRAHAERIDYMFAPGEIDHLYLFFPDPWPKNAHVKNRLVRPEMLAKLAKLVKRGGSFEIRTDHPAYFEWMLKSIDQSKEHWEMLSMTRDKHATDREAAKKLKIPEVTLFERVFILEDIPIQQAILRRK
ncbi:tRNA (guanosine(46)-N7)-methyltransferase TrmB [bacterium]|nr:tRNA (guanosine(46)-N7)-methyltransferase TrmB [bacterium]